MMIICRFTKFMQIMTLKQMAHLIWNRHLKLTEQAKKTLTIKAEFIIIWKNMTRQKKNFRVLMKMDIKMLQFILERFMQSWVILIMQNPCIRNV